MEVSCKYLIPAMVLITASAPAAAQIQVPGMWEGTLPTRTFVVNNNISSSCLPSLTRAVNRFNALASKLTMKYTNPSWTSYTHASSPNGYTNSIVDTVVGSEMSQPGRAAEIGYGHKTTEPKYSPGLVPYFAFADIIINKDLLYYASGFAGGQFYCPATGGTTVRSGAYDMEYTLTHEVTHVAGADHNPVTGTLMYYQIPPSTPTPAYSSDESGLVYRLYGRK